MLNKITAASQVAKLINKNNSLRITYNKNKILGNDVRYTYLHVPKDGIIAVVGVEHHGYLYTEIKHVSVASNYRRKGLARRLVNVVMSKVTTPFIFATIREGNTASFDLFKSLGFKSVSYYTYNEKRIYLMLKSRG